MIEQNKKKISVIVPVYNVENYIGRCIDSLVNQTLRDIEVVIVNDGSTDDSQKVIDEYVRKYPDKIKAYTIKNSGAANARNYALDKATGEYIGFVDSDDYVAKDMYEKLYNKAIEDNADIVNCGYYRETETRCVEKETVYNPEFGNSVFENPYLIVDSVPYIWNKIFKRKIIEDNKIRFPNLKIYEDLVFTYELFVEANKISKVFEPLYFYTVTRETSLTFKFTEKRFDIFEAFNELIKFMEKKNCFEQFKEEILFTLLKHIYVVLEKDVTRDTAKLKKKYIKEVFSYLNKNFKDWNENFYFEKFRKNKKQYTSKVYWTIKIYVKKGKRKKIKKLINTINKIEGLTNSERFIGKKYLKYLKHPIDEKSILLNSQQGDNINGNMFYILKELLKNETYADYKIYVAYKYGKKESFQEKLQNYNLNKLKLIEVNTKAYVKVLATAKYLFNDTSFPVYFLKRKEQVYLNTWHGTPLKTLGKATANDFHDIANLQKNFVVSDYLLYPSKYMLDIMERDYMLENTAKGKAILCGYPRNEIFLDKNRREELKKKLNLNGKTVIAYMPTWRGNVRKVLLEEQLEGVKEYLKEINDSLKENQVLYVNFHPYVGNNIEFDCYDKILPFPKEYETYDFLNLCDILITDYSSVFFDYAITRNKIILFTYDEEEYLKDRGMYISLQDLPFPKVIDVKQLIKEINLPKQYDDTEFIKTYCNYDKVNTSEQICKFIILNDKKSIKTENFKHNDKKLMLIYAGPLVKNKRTDKLISICENTPNKKYNYYISYVTRNVKKNKRQLKVLEQAGMNYWGQLGTLNNMGRLDLIILSLMGRLKSLFNIFNKRIDLIYKIETQRIYDNIKFEGVILFGKIGVRKIYQFSLWEGKKILCLTSKEDFNKRINPKVYEKYDYILTQDQETFDIVSKYCKNNKNVRLIDNIDSLDDFEKVV